MRKINYTKCWTDSEGEAFSRKSDAQRSQTEINFRGEKDRFTEYSLDFQVTILWISENKELVRRVLEDLKT